MVPLPHPRASAGQYRSQPQHTLSGRLGWSGGRGGVFAEDSFMASPYANSRPGWRQRARTWSDAGDACCLLGEAANFALEQTPSAAEAALRPPATRWAPGPRSLVVGGRQRLETARGADDQPTAHTLQHAVGLPLREQPADGIKRRARQLRQLLPRQEMWDEDPVRRGCPPWRIRRRSVCASRWPTRSVASSRTRVRASVMCAVISRMMLVRT